MEGDRRWMNYMRKSHIASHVSISSWAWHVEKVKIEREMNQVPHAHVFAKEVETPPLSFFLLLPNFHEYYNSCNHLA
jgi:hypothetical protein